MANARPTRRTAGRAGGRREGSRHRNPDSHRGWTPVAPLVIGHQWDTDGVGESRVDDVAERPRFRLLPSHPYLEPDAPAACGSRRCTDDGRFSDVE